MCSVRDELIHVSIKEAQIGHFRFLLILLLNYIFTVGDNDLFNTFTRGADVFLSGELPATGSPRPNITFLFSGQDFKAGTQFAVYIDFSTLQGI